MAQRLALKRLTASDLTFFQWQFVHRNAGNQKAINLNADVFIDMLYPNLPESTQSQNGRIPLDLYLYGPGLAPEYNLQRKIVKFGTYKNWRMNGEFVTNPPDDPDRFNILNPGDFCLFDFQGELIPNTARVVFVAASLIEDASLHNQLHQFLRNRKMMALTSQMLNEVIAAAGVHEQHPVYDLLLENALEDASQGGIEGIRRLQSRVRVSHRRISSATLQQARENAGRIGRLGEEFINNYLSGLKREGTIHNFEWVSDDNAVAPYDFRIEVAEEVVLIDVKTTENSFNNPLHISYNELLQMRDVARYDLYRVYEVRGTTAQMRIAFNLNEFSRNILRILEELPQGVRPDGISVDPLLLQFEDPILIQLWVDEE
jgi:hypothetical protein